MCVAQRVLSTRSYLEVFVLNNNTIIISNSVSHGRGRRHVHVQVPMAVRCIHTRARPRTYIIMKSWCYRRDCVRVYHAHIPPCICDPCEIHQHVCEIHVKGYRVLFFSCFLLRPSYSIIRYSTSRRVFRARGVHVTVRRTRCTRIRYIYIIISKNVYESIEGPSHDESYTRWHFSNDTMFMVDTIIGEKIPNVTIRISKRTEKKMKCHQRSNAKKDVLRTEENEEKQNHVLTRIPGVSTQRVERV